MRVKIDGKEIRADGKKTILEVARKSGIRIPSLCDHPELIPFTGCRLCLVQIKGRRGFVPSCSTYPEPGMEIKTRTPRLRALRTQILELILSEHPSACLICSEKDACDDRKSTIRKVGETTGCVLCPNNGRCGLQEVVEEINPDRVRFPFVYRDLEIKGRDPFFEQNYNLCILCGRCVRVCREIRGNSVINLMKRGSKTVVGTVLDKPLLEAGCRFCGACVDVCPTGALTEKAIKYQDPPSETGSTVCALCAVGCRMELGGRDGRLLTARPAADGPANQGQACVKGRFMIPDVIDSDRRILRPMIRRKKRLEEVSWEEALDFTAGKLKSFKGRETAVVASAQVGCEDAYVLRRFAGEVLKTRRIGSPTFGSPYGAFRSLAKRLGWFPGLNFRMDEIAGAEAVVLAAGDLPDSHPVVWVKVLEAVRRGAELIVIDAADRRSHRFATAHLRAKPGTEPILLVGLSRLLLGRRTTGPKGFDAFRKAAEAFEPGLTAQMTGIEEAMLHDAAARLKGKRPVILFGSELVRGRMGEKNLAALWNLALLTHGRLAPLGNESNARGWFELEGRGGTKTESPAQIMRDVAKGDIKALYLAGPAPWPKKARPDFLVVQDTYFSAAAEKADVVLPAAAFTESEGTFVNLEGRLQRARPVRKPPAESRPDWWIFTQLAVRLGGLNFAFLKAADVLREIGKAVPGFAGVSSQALSRGREFFIHETRRGRPAFLTLPKVEPVGESLASARFRLRLMDNPDRYRGLILSEAFLPFRLLRDSDWVVLSDADAARLKLSEGDPVEVTTPQGKLSGKVRLSGAPPPGTVIAAPPFPPPADAEPVMPAKIKRGKR